MSNPYAQQDDDDDDEDYPPPANPATAANTTLCGDASKFIQHKSPSEIHDRR